MYYGGDLLKSGFKKSYRAESFEMSIEKIYSCDIKMLEKFVYLHKHCFENVSIQVLPTFP